MSKRFIVALVTAMLAATLVVGTVVFASARKSVTVAVDGEEKTITTYGDTVGEVLEAQGVEVGDRDAVAPALDSEIGEGTRIAVSYGRQLALKVDGERQTYWTTARSVDAALAQIGQRFLAGSELSTSRSSYIGRDGLTLVVRTPKDVRLVIGRHEPVAMTTPGLTVGEALLDQDVELGRHDEVEPRLSATLDGDTVVVVTRVLKKKTFVTGSLPYETVVRETDDMYAGETRISRDGTAGTQRVTHKIIRVNGELERKRVVARERTRPVGQWEFRVE